MKRVFIFLAVAGILTACNNSSTTTENKKDSLDSAAGQKKEMIDSAAEQKKDNIDSATKAKKEALDKKDSANRAIKKDSTKK
jgi:hypothetical protein